MSHAPDLARRLAAAYSALVQRLLYPGSEADSPYRPFSAELNAGGEIGTDTFRSAAHLARWWQVDLTGADDWFEQVIGSTRSDATDDSAAYDTLHRIMRATLTGALHYATARADSPTFHPTRHYIVGRVPGGGIAGLITLSIET